MTDQNDTQIVNASPVGYFTMIPNILMDLGYDPYAFRLYCQFVRRAGWQEGGACWENTRNLAESCLMSVGAVSKAKKRLVETGLIKIEKIAKGHGEFPYDRITLVDIWQWNIDNYTRSPSEQDQFTTGNGPFTPNDGTVHQEVLKNIPLNNYHGVNNHPENKQPHTGTRSVLHPPRAKSARGETLSRVSSPEDIAFREWFKEKQQHPAIVAIKYVTGHYPKRARAVYDQLIEWIGEEPNIKKMEWAYGEWIDGKGGNPMKTTKWVLDGYVNGFYYEVENYIPKPEE